MPPYPARVVSYGPLSVHADKVLIGACDRMPDFQDYGTKGKRGHQTGGVNVDSFVRLSVKDCVFQNCFSDGLDAASV